MNNWEDEGLILSRTKYSESSLILKVFSSKYGIRKGLVRGGKKNRSSFIYETGNLVNIIWRGRNEEALGSFRCELIKTNSALFINNSLKFTALISTLNLIEFTLLENDPEDVLYKYTVELIDKIYDNKNWLKNYVFWELKLLEKIGFGLNLNECVLTSSKKDLKYVSPTSGCAVSSAVDKKWINKLLLLPKFLIENDDATIQDIINGLKLTQVFLEKFSQSINKKIPFTRNHFIDNIFLYHRIK